MLGGAFEQEGAGKKKSTSQTDYHHPVDPDSYTVVPRGVADLYP